MDSSSEIDGVPSQAEVMKARDACDMFLKSLQTLKRKRSPVVIMKVKSSRGGGERIVVCADKSQADKEKVRLEEIYSQEKLDIACHLCPMVYPVRDDLPPPMKKPRFTSNDDDRITGSDTASKRNHAVTFVTTKKPIPETLVSSRSDRLSIGSCMTCCQHVEEPMLTKTPCCENVVCVQCVETISTAWCSKSHRKMVLVTCILCGKKNPPSLSDDDISQLPETDSLSARYVAMFWYIVSKKSPKVRQTSAVKQWRALQNFHLGNSGSDDDNSTSESTDTTSQEEAEANRQLMIEIDHLKAELDGLNA